ncbi:MAG: CBS domain-containing protein [Dehalococcoidia bacterium]
MTASPSAERQVAVAALMSRPLITIAPDADLRQARAMMQQHGVHHLLVEDRGRIVGLISDRDIAQRLPAGRDLVSSRRDEEIAHRRVLQVAAFDLVTVEAEASVEVAAALLLDHGISALPVRDPAGEIVGIVTSRDLLRGLLACVLPTA